MTQDLKSHDTHVTNIVDGKGDTPDNHAVEGLGTGHILSVHEDIGELGPVSLGIGHVHQHAHKLAPDPGNGGTGEREFGNGNGDMPDYSTSI